MRTLVAASVMAGTLMGPARASAPEAPPSPEPTTQKPRSTTGATPARHWYQGPGRLAFTVGHLALEQEDWKTAKSKMTEALALDPDQPEANVRTYGGWIKPYLPSYYLALARCRVDHCSENMDEVLTLIRDAGSDLLKRHRADCQNQARCAAQAPQSSPDPP
jgi:hypothetical protein